MTKRMLLSLLLAAITYAQAPAPITIDAGSETDQNFIGGLTTTFTNAPPEITDKTARFANFSYKIPVENIPYILTFHWIENVATGPGQRLFSVKVNNQLVFDNLDLWATGGAMKPITRSVLVVGSDKALTIVFTTQVRNAIISSIDITPLPAVVYKECNPATITPKVSCLGFSLAQVGGGKTYVIFPAGDPKKDKMMYAWPASPEQIAAPAWK